MSEDALNHRRQWFECFPAGTIEFNLITRVLAVGTLGALAVMPESQHLLILNGLAGILWADFILLIWWTVQLGNDLITAIESPTEFRSWAHRRSLICAFWCILPTLPALLLLAPWAAFIIQNEALRAKTSAILIPVLAIGFVASLPFAVRAMRRLQLANTLWSFLWFIPILNLFVLHRIIKSTQNRIQHHRLEAGLRPDEHVMGASLIAGDVVWLLTLIPCAVVLLKRLQSSEFVNDPAGKALIVLATVLFAVFSIIQLALMERLQRQFLSVIVRKHKQA
jgi:hypothetical protein